MSTSDNIRRAKKLSARLKRVDTQLDIITREIARTDQTSNAYWSKINRRIKNAYDKARVITRIGTEKNIPEVYRNTMREQLKKIKSKKIFGLRDVKYTELANTHIAKQSIESLIDSTLVTFGRAYDGGQRTMIELSRLTQQLLVEEKLINQNIAQGFIEGGSVNTAKKRARDHLLDQAFDSKYISILDKNGKLEQWKINTYSELVARTKLQETSTQAVVNTTMSVGGDLVQVSSHNTTTPYDAQFEGKIFSLSGNDPEFPKATDLPPFHPNCLHSITTTFRESLSSAGILGKSIAFANDETDIHPTRKSHIPVSKRSA